MTKHRVVPVSLVVLVIVGWLLSACGSPQPTPLPPPPTAEPTQPPTETPVPTVAPTTRPPTATPTLAPTDVATQTIYAALKAAPQFSTLVAALEQAGLTETLELPGPFTVFAPNDAAFKALPQDQIDALLKNDTLLTEVLLYHVAPGRFTAADLSTMRVLTTALTSTVLTVAGSGTGVTLNDTAIVSPSLAASNGLVYEMAGVLLPTPISAAAPVAHRHGADHGHRLVSAAHRARSERRDRCAAARRVAGRCARHDHRLAIDRRPRPAGPDRLCAALRSRRDQRRESLRPGGAHHGQWAAALRQHDGHSGVDQRRARHQPRSAGRSGHGCDERG